MKGQRGIKRDEGAVRGEGAMRGGGAVRGGGFGGEEGSIEYNLSAKKSVCLGRTQWDIIL